MTVLPDLCLDAPAANSDDVAVAGPKRSSSTPSSKTVSSSVDAEDRSSSDSDADQKCGWGPIQPHCCQVFRNAKVVLFFLCCLATIQVTYLLVYLYLLADILSFCIRVSICPDVAMKTTLRGGRNSFYRPL